MALDLVPPPPAVSYVNAGASMKLATLLSAFPPGVDLVGLYARVSDLFGSVDDVMRCRYDGTNYNWVPQRESASGTTAISSGNFTFTPLTTPTTTFFMATALTGNINIAMSTTNAYNGMPAELVTQSGLGLGIYTMMITGLIGSNLSLAAGQTRRLRYGPGGWYTLP